MELIESFKRIIENPLILAVHVCRHVPFRWISDESFVRLLFYTYQHYKLDLDNPITFNEKLQWLKLYDRNPQYTICADKYRVRNYVEKCIGKEHLVPLIGVWDNVDEIDYSTLPNQFVLKCNHDSGSVFICKDKSVFNNKKANRKLKHAMKLNQFWRGREWSYLNIKRKIIAEEYIVDDNESTSLSDFKFFCFNGEPRFLQVDKNRFTNHTRNFYTSDWEFIDVISKVPNDKNHIDKPPKQLSEMIEIAKKLSKNIPHVRVDLYLSNNTVYFGEMTFYHAGGCEIISPHNYDVLWGSYITVKNKQESEKK